VLQPDPFGPDLEHLVTGESLAGRPFRVRQVSPTDTPSDCHAIFVSGRSDSTAAASLLKRLAGRPILTVGETDRFLDDGGIIALTVVDRRVRFNVDASNAQRAGLRINAQLLRLAAAVRGGPS
jgi:hypothetical protein